VVDGADTTIVDGVTRGVVVTGTPAPDVIRVRASGGNLPLAGTVTVHAGADNDIIDLSGQIGGKVTLYPGTGDDQVTSNLNPVAIGGGLTVTDSAGTDSLNLNGRDYQVDGNLAVSGVEAFTMEAGSDLVVGGSITLGGPAAQINAQFDGATTRVGGALQLTGAAGNDTLLITSQLTVNGALTVRPGGGNNTFVLNPPAGGLGVLGPTTFVGGAGTDVVVLGADSRLLGSAAFHLGGGINTFVDTPTSRYTDLSVVGGGGTNSVIVGGQLAAGLRVAVGGGDGNTLVFTGSIGTGTLRYRGGAGKFNVVTLAPTAALTVTADIVFGAGVSTFNLGPNLTLDGVVRVTGGEYTFNPGAAVLAPSLRLVNFA
jgi:hypothetical protein